MTVHTFPGSETPQFLVGPFEEWRVVIEGRIIPRLTGRREGYKVLLSLDHRFTLECANEGVAYQTAWFVAQALAIGEGYSDLSAETKQQPFAPLGAPPPIGSAAAFEEAAQVCERWPDSIEQSSETIPGMLMRKAQEIRALNSPK